MGDLVSKIIGGALLIGSLNGCTRQPTANEALHQFPTELPGIERIDKYETPGAKQTIVLIRQMHLHPFMGVGIDEATDESKPLCEEPPTFLEEKEGLKKINTIQKGIYDSLSSIIAEDKCKQVYTEGIYIGDGKTTTITAYHTIKEKTDELKKYGYFDEFKDDKPYLVGGIHLLAEEKKLKIRGFENPATHSATIDALTKNLIAFVKISKEREPDPYMTLFDEDMLRYNTTQYTWEYMNERREDILLDVLSKDKSSVVYAILGAGHSIAGAMSFQEYNYDGKFLLMKDNIFEWNKENPEHKYSLIELTPEGFD